MSLNRDCTVLAYFSKKIVAENETLGTLSMQEKINVGWTIVCFSSHKIALATTWCYFLQTN